ncbi:uncharacterized protein [Neodiprion pinetum]|uniref:Uncharacterized protein LOC107222216 n=1 Tax=Neodiprion lecontei TaxID=441921 RepID=A0ABM3FEV1_NEOLC|nr:uncharacterized protein LOC124211345 [Neodiprion pinetum]XP_046586547.1 uncharacterized protein LOC107222216 [Neodiprion lecontei]
MTMDNRFIFKTIFLLLIATTSEAIFFDYPKKALMDFFHSLKEKKESAKKSHDDVHHYHLHYYPVPVSVVIDDHHEHLKAPGKHELDNLHREELRSLGWTDQEYKHVPEPELIIPKHQHHETGGDLWPQQHQSHLSNGLTLQDQIDIAAIRQKIERHSKQQKYQPTVEHHHPTHISLHLPFHQEIILHQPAPAKEEKKVHPLTAFFEKLHSIKNSLFSSHDDKKSHQCDDKSENVATITSKIKSSNAFTIYTFHPKNLRKY